MISDSLFDAIQEIEEYQRDGGYKGWDHRIEPVKRAMRELQRDLDVHPSSVVTCAEDVIHVTPAAMLVRRQPASGDETAVRVPLGVGDLVKIREAIDFVLEHKQNFNPPTEDTVCVSR